MPIPDGPEVRDSGTFVNPQAAGLCANKGAHFFTRIRLVNGKDVFVWTMRVAVESGALVCYAGFGGDDDQVQEMPVMVWAPGTWEAVVSASALDESPVRVDKWYGYEEWDNGQRIAASANTE